MSLQLPPNSMHLVIRTWLLWLTGLAFILSTWGCASQRVEDSPPEPAYMHKMDAPLRMALSRDSGSDPLPVLIDVEPSPPSSLLDELEEWGFDTMSVSGSIISGRGTPDIIRRIAAREDVRSISLSATRGPN